MQIFWMVFSSLMFACMGVCIKFASAYFSNAELIFYRGLVGLVFMAVYARSQGVSLATSVPGMHAWRGLVGVASLAGWFYAIAHLPLATAMTLNYMSSIWMAVFVVFGSVLFSRLGNRPPARRLAPLVIAILAGFGGVVLLLRPAIAQNQMVAALTGLLSGVGAAVAYMQVMAISKKGEPESRIVFYFAATSLLAGAIGMAWGGISAWHWRHALWLLPLGILASLGQLSMTRAYSMSQNAAATLVVANLQYSGVVFAVIFGMLVFGDAVAPLGWLGMAIIVASAAAASWLQSATTQRAELAKP